MNKLIQKLRNPQRFEKDTIARKPSCLWLSLLVGVALNAACGGESTNISSGISESEIRIDGCSKRKCGLAPGAPNFLCPDGTVGGPVCKRENGVCGWQIVSCPEECTSEECGPAPGMPNFLCPDGTVGGPVCQRENGACGWQIRDCS